MRAQRGSRVRALILLAAGMALAACSTALGPPSADPDTATATATATPTPTAGDPSATPSACQSPCRARPRTVGTFKVRRAPEASGLVAGIRNPGVLYVLDDGPGTTSLLAIRARDAKIVGEIQIAGLQGLDTEDLAAGPCGAGDSTPCLYIGDIGDNLAVRDAVAVVRVVEPDLTGGVPEAALPSDAVTLRYPGGPRNAEALIVTPDGGMVIITKSAGRRGRGAARLYVADAFGDQTLRRGGRLRLPAPSFPLAGALVGNVVTAADATAGRVVVRTYDALYEFSATPDADPRRFPTWTMSEIPAPAEVQGEAVAYAADGCGLFTVSEGSGALTSIPCR